MSRDIVPFGLRMPPDLKARIEKAAHDNGRSMNAEIVHRLQQAFAEADPEAAERATEALSLSKPHTKYLKAAKDWAVEIARPDQRPILEALLATTLAIASRSGYGDDDDMVDDENQDK